MIAAVAVAHNSDKLFVQGNAYAGEKGSRFACVRYGNIIGSRGSVSRYSSNNAKAAG